MSKLIFLLILTLSALINFKIYFDGYQHILIFFWLLTIISLFFTIKKKFNPVFFRMKIRLKRLLLITLILLPVIVRVVNYNLTRIHTDDLITAYFSATYNFKTNNFFSGIPTDKSQWVSQFPSTYFILQKLFFILFGESLLTIKLSVLPYVYVTSIFLFLTGREIFGGKTASIAIIIYSYIAISLYLETLGLHFISSTAVFNVFFYYAIKWHKYNSSWHAVITGISCGFCYLFYTTSYIALPFLIILCLYQLYRFPMLLTVKNIILSLFAFIIVLSPFITHSLRFENYFLSRIKQVFLINGEWSGYREEIEQGITTVSKVLSNNFAQTVQSLYSDNIGGQGGYTFSNLALLEKTSQLLILFGLLILLLFYIKKPEILFILLVILFSFTGMVFSIPPPAFHRFSLTFPYLALVASIPFHFIFQLKQIPRSFSILLSITVLLIYIYANQNYFIRGTINEISRKELGMGLFINSNFPNRNLYIASFPGFSYEKIYYFIPGKNAKSIRTDYHDRFLNNFNRKEKYLYILIYPEEFSSDFQQADPRGRIFNYTDDYSLFVN